MGDRRLSRIAEHLDVSQDEATAEESKSGLPMIGTRFPSIGETDGIDHDRE
jgi:hypothetical protein